MIIANIPLGIQLGVMLLCSVAGLWIFHYCVIRVILQGGRPQNGPPESREEKSTEVASKTSKILLDELKTSLVKTLRKRDRESQCDSAFWASFSLVGESEEFGVVVLRVDTNNYGYQIRTGNFKDSNAWENLVIATRKGYCFLGRVNLYKGAVYNGPFQITKSESGSIVVSWGQASFTIKDEEMRGGYDFPFELPPRSEMVRTVYNLNGAIVVIDDDPGQGRYVQFSVDQMGKRLKADRTVWDLPGCVRCVKDAIQYLPDCSGRREQVRLVLVDGNFSGDGRGFNTGRLIPVLRERYPNALLFANSGMAENHTNHTPELLAAGCDCALSIEDYGYKSNLTKILARVAELKPEILVSEELDLNEVLKI
jgi:hypothetical protein